ncbi:MAG: CRISPR-associated helicase Cas3' [Candidatus Dadabacteria bacterium]|nr:CRISPR-associated helicase Cas3' [Candidatus Dadabacteria bacterium]
MSCGFRSFFSIALGNDIHPYSYQQALAEQDWPDILIAPTGLGKTAAVVLSWAWKHTLEGKQAPPRRLAYCLPMRTLVEQTEENIRKWLKRLHNTDSRWKICLPDPENDVHILMGGVDETEWYKNPERPTVLIGTQDMLLSRALMRGYAMNRFRWPLDFGLLHNDTQWVFDEVQLMSSGLATSSQLEGFRRNFGTQIPSRSLWISATMHPKWLKTADFQEHLEVWNVPRDFLEDKDSSKVQRLVHAPKPIKKADTSLSSTKKEFLREYAKNLASEALSLHREGQMTLLVVNTVARAQAVHKELAKKGISSDRLVLVHSRFRPADRKAQMDKLPNPGEEKDLVVVATQAIEAGVDISASVMITEIASASSIVQRLGRVNRYGELNNRRGGAVRWIDIVADEKSMKGVSAPYSPQEIEICRKRITSLTDAKSPNLPSPEPDDYSVQSVIRGKDLKDLYDTDPDLTGFDVDISSYVRDSEDTDVKVFWRDLIDNSTEQPMPSRHELCSVPIGRCKNWLKSRKIAAFFVDLQANSRQAHSTWVRFNDSPWPGLVLMLDLREGGYTKETGFDPESRAPVEAVAQASDEAANIETSDGDPGSRAGHFINLADHLVHVVDEAKSLCSVIDMPLHIKKTVSEAALWHDVGKAHDAFQERMSTDDPGLYPRPDCLLAKARYYDRNRGRPYFRHELASALAYLAHAQWSREADLTAYLIAAHHGKVRMNLKALPQEITLQTKERGNGRNDIGLFARGVREGDEIPPVKINGKPLWAGGHLDLSVMVLGEHPVTGASWTERTSNLLSEYGPFRLAWLEAILRVADWRASEKENEKR